MAKELRDYRAFEIRAQPGEGDTPSYRVEGYAAVFDQETVLYECEGVKYKEVIDRNSFNGADVRNVVMNYNHGGKPVARTKNGTLVLTVDNKGLRIAANLGGTAEGRQLYEEIKGGYIDQMSFAFTVKDEHYDRKAHLRRITGFERIFDVAAVDMPAYDGTSIAARGFASAEREAEREKLRLRLKLAMGK